jgi:hypothetical protein
MFDRRKFGIVAAAALAATALEHKVFAQAKKSSEGQPHTGHGNMAACAKACADCQLECDSCAAHCAQMIQQGRKEHATTLATCQDCADACTAAARITARGGPFAAVICRACAEACARCGKECEKFPDDGHMKRCAEECRQCEKACREMVEHQHAAK